nr:hypothetical protein [Tanacetum cinerariifolium]
MCEMFCQFIQKKQEEKQIEEEQADKAQNSKIPVCCDDDDDFNSAITPNEPVDSLSMGDEHLDTIPATELDEFIKSSVENLVPNLSESEGKNGCDVPACFTTFSNILFHADYDFYSVDNQSLSDEDFSEKIFSNPLFEEEIIPIKIDQHHHNDESGLIESMLTHDSSIISSSSKIDSLLDEFAGELTLLKSIPPGIDKTDCYPEEEIHLIERLFNSFMEEINLFLTPDDPMPPGIEEDDYDSKRDILIREELLDNYSLSLPVIESFYFDIPSFSHPLAKPPDGNTGILNIKIMGDISKQKLSTKCPMMIHGKNIPILDVPLFHFYPLDQLNLLHLVGSQPMLKSSYKAEASVIISIPPLVGGVADVVVEIKGTGWSISITLWFSVGLQTPDDLSRSRLGFVEKMGVKDKQEKDKIETKPDKNGKRGKARRYRYIDNRLGDAIQKAIQAYNLDCREEAQDEKRDYIEHKNVAESLEAVVLARSSAQPKSTYDAAASLSEFELTKILIDKRRKNVNEIASLMDTVTIPPPPPFFNPLSQQATPTSTPTASETTTSLHILPDFASVFKFNDRVTNLEKDLLEMKQVNQIKSSTRVTMMKNSLTRRFPRLTGLRNPNDLQLLILTGIRDNVLTPDLLRPELVKLTIMKKYDYDHLEEIEVRREDQKLYKLREDPKGVIYKDQNDKNRLMRADELHKFSDGTLNDVRTALNDIAKGIRMEYLPKREWSGLDKRRAQVMV